jgi:hypothetical protein
MSFLQNSVSFAKALAVLRPRAANLWFDKTALFSGCSFKTEVLKEPLMIKKYKKAHKEAKT